MTDKTRRSKAKDKIVEKQHAAKQAVYDKTPDRFKNATSLQVRFRTGAIYVGLSVLCVLLGDIPTMVYLSAISAMCAGEFYYMMRVDARLPNEAIGIVGAACFPIAMWYRGLPGVAVVAVLLVIALLVWFVYYMRARVPDVGVSFFGAAYTGMLLSSLILVRQSLESPWGGVLVLLLFCSVWFNDAGAYLAGSMFGKHKLAPRTSPKKTWEGLIFGLVVSAAIWCLMTLVPGVDMSIPKAIVFGLLCGVSGVVGDLAESRIKRNVGVKDSGTIMPGHGGLLDRCDSMFLASVVATVFLIGGGCIPYVG
ncbi:MAG: phosphatidate cytidylyltransferase [Eggerthellaceae bacterium]|nr:phosphatidate cytidylyltransferase [Eggerthellaceae bacterium]